MSVRLKLITIVIFVALLPISISAYTMLNLHQQSFGETLKELHEKTAELGAARSENLMNNATDVLSDLIRERIDWSALNEGELAQVQWLIYDQLDDIAVVAVLDSEGTGIGPSVYRDARTETASLTSHVIMDSQELQEFGRRLPLAEALHSGVSIGSPVPPTATSAAIVPIAFSVAGPDGHDWVVGVGISLQRLCEALASSRAADLEISLVNRDRTLLCSGSNHIQLGETLLARLPIETSTTMRYRDGDQRDVLAAASPAGPGWTMVTTQPASVAFAPGRRIRNQVIFWIALGALGALLAGLYLARAITRPVATLAGATAEIAKGNYAVSIPVEGRDEFAQLSTAFNAMCAEIQSWNQELTHRVEERTQALSDAQGQLLESRKLAAVAAMSAGIAHEINNPLTAVISFAQVLEARAAKDPSQDKQAVVLNKLAESALRIRDIVQRMQTLSETSGRGMTDQKPEDILEAALQIVQTRVDEAKIDVVIDRQPDTPNIYVQRMQLQGALVHMLDNSIKAMQGAQRKLRLSCRRLDARLVEIEIGDSGKGIPPEAIEKIFEPFFTLKDHWLGQGLGLAEAHQIITANHGIVRVRSKLGEGTTMTLIFPVATQRAHLA